MSAKPRMLVLGELRASPFLPYPEVVRSYVLDEVP